MTSATKSRRNLTALRSVVFSSNTHQSFEHEIIHDLRRRIQPRLESRGVSPRKYHGRLVLAGVDHVTAHAVDRAGERIERAARDRVPGIVGKEAERAFAKR